MAVAFARVDPVKAGRRRLLTGIAARDNLNSHPLAAADMPNSHRPIAERIRAYLRGELPVSGVDLLKEAAERLEEIPATLRIELPMAVSEVAARDIAAMLRDALPRPNDNWREAASKAVGVVTAKCLDVSSNPNVWPPSSRELADTILALIRGCEPKPSNELILHAMTDDAERELADTASQRLAAYLLKAEGDPAFVELARECAYTLNDQIFAVEYLSRVGGVVSMNRRALAEWPAWADSLNPGVEAMARRRSDPVFSTKPLSETLVLAAAFDQAGAGDIAVELLKDHGDGGFPNRFPDDISSPTLPDADR
jgi:hypothetical protein